MGRKVRLKKDEGGYALALVLILLILVGLIIGPLLVLMTTSLMSAQRHETNMLEFYAADAGIEDAIHKILTDNASLQGLDANDSYSYTLTDSVNGLSVNITVTKLSLLEGLVGDREYKEGQPHEDWVSFDTPVEVERTADYVEYSCAIIFNYQGGGNRRVQAVGAFFSPSTSAVIEGPYEITYTPVMTDAELESITSERVSGGFQFVWDWQDNPARGPRFFSGDTGALSFKFKVHDPDWAYSLYFIWALVKEQDISFVTNAPGSYKWLIEASAANTEVRSAVVELTGAVGILTWEIK